MFKTIEKFKNFISYDTEDNTNETNNRRQNTESRNVHNIDTETETIERICDCCNETLITVVSSDMFKISENGEKQRLLSHPKETFTDGKIYDEVAICDNCFSHCETDTHRQYVWIAGKINLLHKETSKKQESIEASNKTIENIKINAEKEIQSVLEKSNVVNSEIYELQTTIESLIQEQGRIESQL